MAIFDGRFARNAFDAANLLLVEFASSTSYVSSSYTSYIYNSRAGGRVLLEGNGITIGSDDRPATGTVTRVAIDVDRNAFIDATISGVSAPASSLIESPQSFWRLLLSGNDVIYAPTTRAATLFGDGFETIGARISRGGNDSLSGGTSAGQTLIGDLAHVGNTAQLLDGALIGGDDIIVARNTRSSSFIYGDAIDAEGAVTGGNDRLTGSEVRADTIVGDVGRQQDGYSIGGDDIINGRGGNDTLIGDIVDVGHFPGGTASSEGIGGRDFMRGGEGNDMIYGDFVNVAALQVGALNFSTPGDDTLYGDGGNDFIVGDQHNDDDATSSYGDDVIYGGADDDTIYGDTVTLRSGANQLGGVDGYDFVDGGSGSDTVLGGFGNDRVFGGAGDDTLEGGFGADFVSGGAGEDLVVGCAGADRLYGDRDALAAADTFFFTIESGPPFDAPVSSGRDRVFDFQDGFDTIEIGVAYGFADAAAVVAATTVNGSDLIIHLSADDSVALIGIGGAPAQLLDNIVIV